MTSNRPITFRLDPARYHRIRKHVPSRYPTVSHLLRAAIDGLLASHDRPATWSILR